MSTVTAEELPFPDSTNTLPPLLNPDNPPDKVVPPPVPEVDEPAVTDTAPPAFDPDNPPDSVATPPTPVAEEPAFINISPPTSFNPVVKPADSTIDPPLPLSKDPTDVDVYSPAPVDPFPETIDIKPLFPEVALSVENSKSTLTLPAPVPALSVLIVALPELVSVLEPDAIVIEPP